MREEAMIVRTYQSNSLVVRRRGKGGFTAGHTSSAVWGSMAPRLLSKTRSRTFATKALKLRDEETMNQPRNYRQAYIGRQFITLSRLRANLPMQHSVQA